jgi:predicted DNA-binding protein
VPVTVCRQGPDAVPAEAARQADAALASRDWSGAEVEPDRPRGASVVHSTRMSRELTERLFAEAARRGVTPSELIREYVEAGLDAAADADADAENTVVTVRLADLHRAIDTAVRRAA